MAPRQRQCLPPDPERTSTHQPNSESFSMSKNTPSNLAVTGVLAILLSACGGGSSSTNSTTTTDSGSSTSTGTSTAGVLCDYASSLFNSSPSVNATATVRWSCSSTQRSVVANGLPDHAVGTFPNSDNPNTIAAQSITLSASLTPTQTTVNTTFGPGAGKPGIALNGIVFDPGTAGTCDDSGTRCQGGGGPGGGTWTMEALGASCRHVETSHLAHP